MKKSIISVSLIFLSSLSQATTIQEVSGRFVGKYKVSPSECTLKGYKTALIQIENKTPNRRELSVRLSGSRSLTLSFSEKSYSLPMSYDTQVNSMSIVAKQGVSGISNEIFYLYNDGSLRKDFSMELVRSSTGGRVRYKHFDRTGKKVEECLFYRIQ